MSTDTSEKGLETLIVRTMTGTGYLADNKRAGHFGELQVSQPALHAVQGRRAGHADQQVSRPRLVADVVTGKLDVREAAAALPQDELQTTLEPDATDLDEVESEE